MSENVKNRLIAEAVKDGRDPDYYVETTAPEVIEILELCYNDHDATKAALQFLKVKTYYIYDNRPRRTLEELSAILTGDYAELSEDALITIARSRNKTLKREDWKGDPRRDQSYKLLEETTLYEEERP